MSSRVNALGGEETTLNRAPDVAQVVIGKISKMLYRG
jgi:hypothetical protein